MSVPMEQQWPPVANSVVLLISIHSSSEVVQSSLPGSSIHGIFQARVLEWVAIAFSIAIALPTLTTPL